MEAWLLARLERSSGSDSGGDLSSPRGRGGRRTLLFLDLGQGFGA